MTYAIVIKITDQIKDLSKHLFYRNSASIFSYSSPLGESMSLILWTFALKILSLSLRTFSPNC